jgi:hypothetical protein
MSRLRSKIIKGGNMVKKSKRFAALFLSAFLVFNSAWGSYNKSYAFALELITGVTTPTIGEVVAALLLTCGVTAGSYEYYENGAALQAWGDDMNEKMWAAFQEHAEDKELSYQEYSQWLTNAASGVLDTTSEFWDNLKWFVGELYNSKTVSDDITTYDYQSLVSGYNIITTIDGDSSGYLRYFTNTSQQLDISNAMVEYPYLTWVDYCDEMYIYVFLTSEPVVFQLYVGKYEGTEKTRLLPYGTYDGFMRCLTIGKNGYSDSYSGTKNGSTTKDLGIKNTLYYGDSPNAHCNYVPQIYYNGALYDPSYDLPEVKDDYTRVGGASDVFDRDNSLDNYDLVGGLGLTGDVAIDWPGLLGLDGVADDAETWADVLAGVIAGVVAGELDWTDVMDGLGVVPVDVATDKVIGNEGVTDEDVSKDEADESTTISADYTIQGLEKLFPFCLPFDLIHFFNVLSAEPEAPCFTIPVPYMTASGMTTYDVEIDLSKFDSVAQLLRTMELLVFIIGLIMITRDKMIKG